MPLWPRSLALLCHYLLRLRELGLERCESLVFLRLSSPLLRERALGFLGPLLREAKVVLRLPTSAALLRELAPQLRGTFQVAAKSLRV